MIDYQPDIFEVTKAFWSPDDYRFKRLYGKVRYYMNIWDNDVERVMEYINKVVVPKEESKSICVPMIDVWDEDSRRASLHRQFFNTCSLFEDIYDTTIQEAVDKFPAENDFDKRYYYVAENLHIRLEAFKEERCKALREEEKENEVK